MLDKKHMPNLCTAVVAQAGKVTEIILADQNPVATRLDNAMFCGMATLAKNFALIILILPRLMTSDVILMMHL